MGNSCSTWANSAFTSLDIYNDSSKLVTKLRERPELLCFPKPAAILGLNDTVLHLAAEHKLLDAAQQVFTFLAGADQEMLRAALRPYCRRKRLPLPNSFPAAARLVANLANNKGQTALMYACYSGCPEIAKLLVEQGADPWIGDNCGSRNALHYAAMAGSAACVEALMKHIMPHMLVRHGLRYINSRSHSGLTPLHYCVFFERQGALQQLLLYEPNINAASTGESYDTYGSYEVYSTALHFAAIRDNIPIARFLLLYYARRRRLGTILDPRMRANSSGKLPWQVARSPAMATLLHPAASLGEVLGREGEEALLGQGGDLVALGPPTLAALAAAALQQKLLAAVEVIEREWVEEDALQRQQGPPSLPLSQMARLPSLLGCTGPPRGTGGGGVAAAAAAIAPECSTSASTLSCLASRGLACGYNRPCSRRHTSGTVIPASPRRAPTLDRRRHPSDCPFPDLADAASGGGGGYGGASGSNGQQQQRAGGTRSAGGAAAAIAAAAASVVLSGSAGGGSRGWASRGPSGRVRGQQSQPWVGDTSSFLGGGGSAGGCGGPDAHDAWSPRVVPGSGSSFCGSSQPVPPGSSCGALSTRSALLIAGQQHHHRHQDHDDRHRHQQHHHQLTAVPVSAIAVGSGSDVCDMSPPTLPGGASPTSSYTPRMPSDVPYGGLTPVGGSPLRHTRSGELLPLPLPAGSSVEDHGIVMPYGANLLSAATLPVTASCVDCDATAAAAAAAVTIMHATATTADEGGVGSSSGKELVVDEEGPGGNADRDGGGDDDDDGTCNLCYARPEAVASSICRHGLCTVCAAELCRALVSKPLLCPFCRRPVANYVRVVKPAAAATARGTARRR